MVADGEELIREAGHADVLRRPPDHVTVEIGGGFAVLAHIFVPNEFPHLHCHIAFLLEVYRPDVSGLRRKQKDAWRYFVPPGFASGPIHTLSIRARAGVPRAEIERS